MPTVDTIVVGAGQAGLATSYLLTRAGHDHIVLERGRVGESWRSHRWDSLRLVTPNWTIALPGSRYGGPDPDGFALASRFVEMLEDYAGSFAAPIADGTTVEEVRPSRRGDSRYSVTTDAGVYSARHVVVATGPHGVPVLPAGLADADTGGATVITATDYRNPAQVAPGGVLVVGASSSGVQIAEELQLAGRDVTLAVGRHSRMPRNHRGLDICWWLEATGRWSREVAPTRAEPSLQLVGRDHGRRSASQVDLAALQRLGVRLTGRLHEVADGTARFGADLPETVAAADRDMHRFLDVADAYAESVGLVSEIWSPERPPPVALPLEPPERLDLSREGIGTIVVAAGYRPHHPWLRVPVLRADGGIDQVRGVTRSPGLYTVGQRFQLQRSSGTIPGAPVDAAYVVDRIAGRSRESSLTSEGAA